MSDGSCLPPEFDPRPFPPGEFSLFLMLPTCDNSRKGPCRLLEAIPSQTQNPWTPKSRRNAHASSCYFLEIMYEVWWTVEWNEREVRINKNVIRWWLKRSHKRCWGKHYCRPGLRGVLLLFKSFWAFGRMSRNSCTEARRSWQVRQKGGFKM